MKKVSKYLLTAGLVASMAAAPMTSYGFPWSATAETKAEETSSYNFVSGTVTITMGAEAAPILNALGTPEKTFEQDSCAYQGKDKVYTYKGFEVSTYPVGGKECISSVYLLDATAVTAEGIKIGSKEDDVKKAYKDKYKEEFGVYRMSDAKTQLNVYTTKGVVDAIEYIVIADQK